MLKIIHLHSVKTKEALAISICNLCNQMRYWPISCSESHLLGMHNILLLLYECSQPLLYQLSLNKISFILEFLTSYQIWEITFESRIRRSNSQFAHTVLLGLYASAEEWARHKLKHTILQIDWHQVCGEAQRIYINSEVQICRGALNVYVIALIQSPSLKLKFQFKLHTYISEITYSLCISGYVCTV